MNDVERAAKIDYLRSYEWLRDEIADDEERLARLDARLYSPPPKRITDMPRGGQPVTMEALVAEKIELQDQINVKCAQRNMIRQSIEVMPRPRDRRILKLMFIDGLTQEETAERISFSLTQTRRYYEEALERFVIMDTNGQ